MAAAVVRHRRQASDGASGPPPLAGAATATVTLDGRLLEALDGQRGRQQKEDDGRSPVRVQGKACAARPCHLGRAHEKSMAPLTPPRVSGVSLAPLDYHCAAERAAAVAQQAPGKPPGRPSLAHIVLGGKAPPQPAAPAVVAAALNAGACGAAAAALGAGGACGAAAAGAAGGPQLLIAEGRSIQRSSASCLDPRVAAYQEIYGDGNDSVCTTPPNLRLECLMRSQACGALGPLTPYPLTPSILTLCGELGLEDEFEVIGASSAAELVDMRTCMSPKLPPL
ncbi:hypothetical protein Agub_g11804 [Astrephomene gubernaculifera]|uniref:Uncharacterized protein n=1 Tax=Astrephomene gubernaculifera TaxID=47775 RepID=A0AAD3DX32_9CHLO|nr:hypothetical protein Agub_g11804 [Astrephomene gubernaculifera]